MFKLFQLLPLPTVWMHWRIWLLSTEEMVPINLLTSIKFNVECNILVFSLMKMPDEGHQICHHEHLSCCVQSAMWVPSEKWTGSCLCQKLQQLASFSRAESHHIHHSYSLEKERVGSEGRGSERRREEANITAWQCTATLRKDREAEEPAGVTDEWWASLWGIWG